MELEREKEQELEWLEAQKIVIGVDLLVAAKQHLKFLAAVDKNRWLYEGPALEKAIYRYNACWLPLLAKHSDSPLSEESLVVPLDCEWVWHCHRLNPVRYKRDCEELYGRILDNSNVVSSLHGNCKRQSEEVWNRLYPDEPYDFDLSRAYTEANCEMSSALEKSTTYDLVSAVRRQTPFFYQVSRPHMDKDIFLEEAVARYKGFLHLVKRSKERSIKCFSVPTYDIDLIWHTHQLHPVSYCKDVGLAIGKILEHDDMDSDRTKGKKLDVGFSGTTNRWEVTFGTRYWKAGAMYRGSSPSSLTTIPLFSSMLKGETVEFNKSQKMIQLPDFKIVDVLLEIVGVKNLPDGHKGTLFVLLSKKQHDAFFNVKQKLTILSETKVKQVAFFQCEPKGKLFFELVSQSPSSLPLMKTLKSMGSISLSLQDLLNPISKLSLEKWVELLPPSGNASSNPICLRIAVSFTVPIQAPCVFHMVHSHPLSKFSCLFPLPGKIQSAKSWTLIIDGTRSEIISLQMRDSTMAKATDRNTMKKQVIGLMKSGHTCTLAEFSGMRWCLVDSQWCLWFIKKSNEDSHLFELSGSRMVKLYQGRKLDFEPKQCGHQRSEQDFLTAVEFSAEDPYGKAVALIELKSGFVKVKEEWFVLPGILSAFIISKTWKKKGYDGSTVSRDNLKELNGEMENVKGLHSELEPTMLVTEVESKSELNADVAKANVTNSGGCGSGCGAAGCGNMVKSGGCGGCGAGVCGGGCGNMIESGGCGGCGAGGCGGGCGNMIESGGCGGCGGGCGNMIESGGSGGCGSGCGNLVKSGGCGGCGAGSCSSGCVNMIKSGGCGGCGAGSCGSGCGGDSGFKATNKGSALPIGIADCPTSEATAA